MTAANERWHGYSEPELLARIEAEHGKEAAEVVARFIAKDELPERFTLRSSTKVGKRAKTRPAIPVTRSTDPDWREKNKERGSLGRLPRSGAPRPPKRAPRDLEGRDS